MSLVLEVALILVLAVLAGSLLALIVQIRRTARTFEAFLASVQRDLSGVAEDVRAMRLRVEDTLDTLEPSLLEFARLSQTAEEVGDTFRRLVATYRGGLEKGAGLVGTALGGLRFFLDRAPQPQPRS